MRFLGADKVAVNALDTFKPIQDLFAHVESGHLENSFGQLLVFSFDSNACVYDQHESKSEEQQYRQSRFLFIFHFIYVRIVASDDHSLKI